LLIFGKDSKQLRVKTKNSMRSYRQITLP